MPRNTPHVVLAGRTRAERKRARAGISLKLSAVTPKTRERYEVAVGLILPFLEKQDKDQTMDSIISEWVEAQWVKGEPVNTIADCLSGLHFFMPELRGTLRNAWRLFRAWRKIETPSRAPPITVDIITALIGRSTEKGDLNFATLIAVGFHALLRTGELLCLQYQDLEFTSQCGVLTLKSSKTGLRHGTEEAVAIRDSLTLQLLETLFSVQCRSPGDKLWPWSAQSFRDTFRRYLQYFRLASFEFKPYSLRRGGATFLLQQGLPLDVILLRGRWHSLAVARLYLEDGLSQIPQIRIPPEDRPRLLHYSYQCPSTAFRP